MYKKSLPVVLSASRMTDMPMFYPEEIIKETEARIQKGLTIHTLVLWTKHPGSLFKRPLHDYLPHLKKNGIQLFVHLTISGLGGLACGIKKSGQSFYPEPDVPGYRDSLALLQDVVSLCGKPERVTVRIDPIINIRDFSGNIFTNISSFPEILEASAKTGISRFAFSFLEPGIHKKADRRFETAGCKILFPDEPVKMMLADQSARYKRELSANVFSCCVAGFPVSKCIDGDLLQELHDQKLPLNKKQLKRRGLCGCTHSIDIGGWPPKKCHSGCTYCYANPLCP